MDDIILITLAILIVLVTLYITPSKKSLKHLPGPWINGLPILGCLPILGSKPFIKLTELSKKFGPVYRLRIGSRDLVVLTDFNEMKKAFVKKAFFGRPKDLPFSLSKTAQDTGAFHNTPWKTQRRFCSHMLSDLGFGKTKMEEIIKEEILEILQRISEQEEELVDPTALLLKSITSNITSFLFGKRLMCNDPLLNNLFTFSKLSGTKFGIYFFPWVRAVVNKFEIGLSGKFAEASKEIRHYCRKEIEEHEELMDPKKIRDLVDGYLLEVQKESKDPNTSFRKEVLEDVVRLFLFGGSENLRTALSWMLLVCANYPEVQRKIHSEIDNVIGRERFPTWKDHLSMPYTWAAILESLRWKSSAPFNVLRYTLEDTELKGYFIPKHTLVLPVTWAVDYDTQLWGKDVYEYKPERFLSKDGSEIVKPEYAIPFSIGKRECPGKSLAEVEMFLYLVAIIRKFQLQPPTGKKIELDFEVGSTLRPKEQKLLFKRRH